MSFFIAFILGYAARTLIGAFAHKWKKLPEPDVIAGQYWDVKGIGKVFVNKVMLAGDWTPGYDKYEFDMVQFQRIGFDKDSIKLKKKEFVRNASLIREDWKQ